MPIHDNDLELEKRRRDAGISQADMANFLGISQSQVSRYEQDPENVPAGVLRKWLQLCGDIASSKGIDVANPRTEITTRIKLIEDYVSVEPVNTQDQRITPSSVTATQFLAGLYIAARKPRIGVFGKFDSGKSSLLNVLLGNNRLPTSFQPTTSTISIIRHISEKPSWQAEDVWVMKRGFDLDKVDNEKHCDEHKLFAGGYEALRQYGTHNGSGKTQDAFAAVVYIDAPLLNCADFLDLPGYGHNEEDKDRAEMARKLVDVLLYLSPATGFMDQNDLLYLSVLLRNLACMPVDHMNANSLRNVYVIATHSHHLSPVALEEMLQTAVNRCFKHLDNTLASRADPISQPPCSKDFGQRFFTFSADDAGIRGRFESDLVELLTDILPKRSLCTLNNQVEMAKKSAREAWSNELDKLMKALQEREQAQVEYNKIIDGEPERLAMKAAQEKRIHNLIAYYATQSESHILQTFAKKTTVSAIEDMIRQRYDDKKEGHKLAAPYLLEVLQTTIEEWIRAKSSDLGKEIDTFLEDYGPKIDGSRLSDGWTFNARVAFMGALSGLGTVGALAAWAALAAAGSNLGGYILVAQIVGWLSSIGISLGGAATVISIVSALGGPITIAVGLGTIVAAAVWAIFGDSWETKLAKKINRTLAEKCVQQRFIDGVAEYWADTHVGFDIAIQKTEEAFQEQLKALQSLAFSTSKEELEHACLHAEKMRDFFGGIPWKALS